MHRSYGFSPKLKMWYIEAFQEKGLPGPVEEQDICTDFALYPMRFYKAVASLGHEKNIDYCFIGAYKTDRVTRRNRKWVIDFINEKFSDFSYLQFTDKKTKQKHLKMGIFDHTLEVAGFVPKEHPVKDRNYFDEHYFKIMTKSKFTLCPAGDLPWSMRFYEALMCKSIPIVRNSQETYRSAKEALLDYKYYLPEDNHIYRLDWVEHNYNVFLKHHTLEFSD